MPKLEEAGGYVARTGAVTTVRAVFFSGPDGTGERIDLGTIVGPRTEAERKATEKKLKQLEERGNKKRKEMNNG